MPMPTHMDDAVFLVFLEELPSTGHRQETLYIKTGWISINQLNNKLNKWSRVLFQKLINITDVTNFCLYIIWRIITPFLIDQNWSYPEPNEAYPYFDTFNIIMPPKYIFQIVCSLQIPYLKLHIYFSKLPLYATSLFLLYLKRPHN
jgi:hypothetical protein